jgi:phosphoribosylglycinamide formyltransferase 1
MIRLAVLLSGRGSNFAAIHEAIERGEVPAQIVAVISNRADAPGVERARAWGYPTHVFDNRQYPSREAHEADVMRVLDEAKPDYIVLAGYMRLLSASFIAKYRGRILNIHPSLLPAFPGVDAQAQAIAARATKSGCTVHFVDEGLDSGPIILQREVEVRPDDDAESLSARILEQEHIAYVEALKRLRPATRRPSDPATPS